MCHFPAKASSRSLPITALLTFPLTILYLYANYSFAIAVLLFFCYCWLLEQFTIDGVRQHIL